MQDPTTEEIPAGEPPSEQSPTPRGRPFQPGTSGNPNGRPKGSRNKATLAMEALLEGDHEAILRKLVEKAKDGDTAAMRLWLERLLPIRRDRAVAFELPQIKNAADVLEASSAVIAACAEGTLSPDEAAKVMEMVSAHVRTLEAVEFEARLQAIERGRPNGHPAAPSAT
jgi:hypothetical protein